MNKYTLFDNIVEKEKAYSFIVSAKELLNMLGIKAPSLGESKQDIGAEGKALNSEAFHYNNAFNLARAKKEDAKIICVEDCSYNSFAQTKEALLEDEVLKEKISSKLKRDGLELSLDTAVLHVNEVIKDVIGLLEFKKMVKKSFANFNIAVFKGNQNSDDTINESILNILGANIVSFDAQLKSDGYEILSASKELADKLAGKVMLDTFDNGADLVIANDVRSFMMFDGRQKNLECSVGRDINLAILSISQIALMALGCDDKSKIGLESHKVQATLL
jgi:succinate dehydrogenase / fumarate reductase cytochrome b subunit